MREIAAAAGNANSQGRHEQNRRTCNPYRCAFTNTVKEIRVIPPACLEMEVWFTNTHNWYKINFPGNRGNNLLSFLRLQPGRLRLTKGKHNCGYFVKVVSVTVGQCSSIEFGAINIGSPTSCSFQSNPVILCVSLDHKIKCCNMHQLIHIGLPIWINIACGTYSYWIALHTNWGEKDFINIL